MFLEVRALALLEAGDPLDESLLQCLRVVRARVEVDPQRAALGVYEVVRTGSSDLGQLCGAFARDERRRPSARVSTCSARAARPPTLRREGPGAHAARRTSRRSCRPAHSRAHLWEHYGAAPRNRLHVAPLRVSRRRQLSGVSPQVTRPCFASSTSLASGRIRDRLGHELREREARPDVRDPDSI